MLFAEPPEKNPPKLGDANVVNIMDYKVDNTGKTVETAKINQAISDVSAKPGGGVLFFPAGGVYMTGTLLMKSNVKLYVDAGALIQGDRQDVRITRPRLRLPGRLPGEGRSAPKLSLTMSRMPAWRGEAPSTWRAIPSCGMISHLTRRTDAPETTMGL